MKRYRHDRILILYHTFIDAWAANLDASCSLPRNATFVVLESDGHYYHVLSGTMSGWFWAHNSLFPVIEVAES